MRIHPRYLLTTAIIASFASFAHATSLGLNTDPGGSAWDRGDANTGYAQLDVFPTFVFSDASPTAFFGVSSPLFSQSSAIGSTLQGAGLYNYLTTGPADTDGDILFQAGQSNATLSFTLTGSTTFAIKGFTLQMKRASSAGGLDANFAPTISINGGAPIAFNSVSTVTGSGDTNSSSGAYGVTTWVWDTSLASNIESGTFTLNIPSTGSLTRGIDFIAADFASVAPVPEPATWLSLTAGLIFVVIVGRRRFSRS